MNERPRCLTHVWPLLRVIETADPARIDWIKSVCAQCGALIGYRPRYDSGKSKRRASYDEPPQVEDQALYDDES